MLFLLAPGLTRLVVAGWTAHLFRHLLIHLPLIGAIELSPAAIVLALHNQRNYYEYVLQKNCRRLKEMQTSEHLHKVTARVTPACRCLST